MLFGLCRLILGCPQDARNYEDMDKRECLSQIIPVDLMFLGILLLILLLFPLCIGLLLLLLRKRGKKDEEEGGSQNGTVEAWSLSIPKDTKTG